MNDSFKKKFGWSKGDIEFADDVTEGSASSGNFGHAGRPGEVGGSAPGGGGGTVDAGGGPILGKQSQLTVLLQTSQVTGNREAVQAAIVQELKRLPPHDVKGLKGIEVLDDNKFQERADKEGILRADFIIGAFYKNKNTRQIVIDKSNAMAKNLLSHEVGHHLYYRQNQTVKNDWNNFFLMAGAAKLAGIAKDVRYPSDYAKINAREFFAEAYKQYNHRDPNERDRMQVMNPVLFGWFERHYAKMKAKGESVVTEGSASSGNFGHAGRPGEVGGSAPGGGGGSVDAGGIDAGGAKSIPIVNKTGFPTEKLAFIVRGLDVLPVRDKSGIAAVVVEKSLSTTGVVFTSGYYIGTMKGDEGEIHLSVKYADFSTVVHEVGHHVFQTGISGGYDGERNAVRRMFDQLTEFGSTKDLSWPSEYAKNNVREFFAEAYKQYHQGKVPGVVYAAPLSKKLKDFFDNHYKQDKISEGSASSGNYGHAGRPGEVGGSGPSGTSGGTGAGGVKNVVKDRSHSKEHTSGEMKEHRLGLSMVKKAINELPAEDAKLVPEIVAAYAGDFVKIYNDAVGLKVLESSEARTCGGLYSTGSGRIYINTKSITGLDVHDNTFHEVGHAVWFKRLSAKQKEKVIDIFANHVITNSFPTDYAKKNSLEFFAECYKRYHSTVKDRAADVIGPDMAGWFDNHYNKEPEVFTEGSPGIEEIKIGKTKLKMASGEIRKFKSKKKRDNFEKMAQAIKHGFVPTNEGSASSGNYGHAGRPGEVGGSAPGGGSSDAGGETERSISVSDEGTIINRTEVIRTISKRIDSVKGDSHFGIRIDRTRLSVGAKLHTSTNFSTGEKEEGTSCWEVNSLNIDGIGRALNKLKDQMEGLRGEAFDWYLTIITGNTGGGSRVLKGSDGESLLASARVVGQLKIRAEKPVTEGSASSGNYGHAGRPGEVGGSAPGGGSVDGGIGLSQLSASEKRAVKEWTGYNVGETVNYRLREGIVKSKEQMAKEREKERKAYHKLLKQGVTFTDSDGKKITSESEWMASKFQFDVEDIVSNLDSIMARSSIDKETTFYRNIDSSHARALRLGQTEIEKGFISVTDTEKDAKEFKQSYGGRTYGYVCKVKVPQGIKGFNIGKYSKWSGEKETLLERGLSLRVIGVNHSKRYVEMEILPRV